MVLEDDHSVARCASLMAARTSVGLSTSLARRASLVVSGVIQSLSSSPPVSPELGFTHQKKLSVMSLDLRQLTQAFSHTPFFPCVDPPHSPVTIADVRSSRMNPKCLSQMRGMLLGKEGSLKQGWLQTLGPQVCGEYTTRPALLSFTGAFSTPCRFSPQKHPSAQGGLPAVPSTNTSQLVSLMIASPIRSEALLKSVLRLPVFQVPWKGSFLTSMAKTFHWSLYLSASFRHPWMTKDSGWLESNQRPLEEKASGSKEWRSSMTTMPLVAMQLMILSMTSKDLSPLRSRLQFWSLEQYPKVMEVGVGLFITMSREKGRRTALNLLLARKLTMNLQSTAQRPWTVETPVSKPNQEAPFRKKRFWLIFSTPSSLEQTMVAWAPRQSRRTKAKTPILIKNNNKSPFLDM